MSWARRGLGDAAVGVLEGWTVVVPTGPARARYPYDDAVRSFAGRQVAVRMRPALGFFQVGRQAVVTVHPARWRAVERFVIWTPREGAVTPTGLAPARAADIVEVAATLGGAAALAAERLILEALTDGSGEAPRVLGEILDALDLPGLDIITGVLAPADLPQARTVAAAPRHARAFDRVVADQARHHSELES